MRRDSIFYKLFKKMPELLFELIEQSVPNADSAVQTLRERYRFDSVEVKETAFRIDGIFLPPDDAESEVIFFSEVQLQKKKTCTSASLQNFLCPCTEQRLTMTTGVES